MPNETAEERARRIWIETSQAPAPPQSARSATPIAGPAAWQHFGGMPDRRGQEVAVPCGATVGSFTLHPDMVTCATCAQAVREMIAAAEDAAENAVDQKEQGHGG